MIVFTLIVVIIVFIFLFIANSTSEKKRPTATYQIQESKKPSTLNVNVFEPKTPPILNSNLPKTIEYDQIFIKYRDNDGNITERTISNIELVYDDLISAFCHLRNEKRRFHISNILYATDPTTGIVINPFELIPGPPTIGYLTYEILPAIKALKFFIKSIKGFSKRERKHVLKFIRGTINVEQFSDELIDDWLHYLWHGVECSKSKGTIKGYIEILNDIPSDLLEKCRKCATKVATGSGRYTIDPVFLDRINKEFSKPPQLGNWMYRIDDTPEENL